MKPIMKDIMDLLLDILNSCGDRKYQLVNNFMNTVWTTELDIAEDIYDVLDGLATALDFYEPNKKKRRTDKLMLDDDKCNLLVKNALRELDKSGYIVKSEDENNA